MTKSVKDIIKIYEEIRTDELFVFFILLYICYRLRNKVKKKKNKDKKSVNNVEYLFLV